MIRAPALVLISFLVLTANDPPTTPVSAAVVHLKILHAPSGDDLGTAKVSFFKSESDSRDYAKQFRDNVASNIPYGNYRLRVYQDGFWSAEREVVVKQPDVWVVMGLELGGIDYDQRTFNLSGTVRHLPSTREPVWVRLTGVHSTLVRDAKVDDSGNFLIAGLPQDKCVLIVWSGTQVLDVRPVTIPSDKPLLIDLAQQRRKP